MDDVTVDSPLFITLVLLISNVFFYGRQHLWSQGSVGVSEQVRSLCPFSHNLCHPALTKPSYNILFISGITCCPKQGPIAGIWTSRHLSCVQEDVQPTGARGNSARVWDVGFIFFFRDLLLICLGRRGWNFVINWIYIIYCLICFIVSIICINRTLSNRIPAKSSCDKVYSLL